MELFKSIFSSAKPLLFNGLVILCCIIGGIVIQWVTFRWLKFRDRKKPSMFREQAIIYLRNPTKIFLPVFVTYTALPYLQVHTIWQSVIEIVLVINFAWLLVGMLKAATELVNNRFEVNGNHRNKDRKVLTQLKFIKNIVMVIIATITFAVLLQYIPGVQEIGKGLLTSAGVVGIIVGIAAQKTIANLIAGFQIAFTQPIKIDDLILVEGELGWVEDISLTYVIVKTWDWRRLILPLNYFNEKPFENWTLHSSELIGSIFLYVDYSFPVQQLRIELLRILTEDPLWDKKEASLVVTKLNQRTMELRATFSAKDSSDIWTMRCKIREDLISFIQNNYPEHLPLIRSMKEGGSEEAMI